MSAYEWTTALSVGEADIDDDHREMFRLLHALEDADLSENGLTDIIRRLESYAEHHFAREEALMRRHAYPDIEAHISLHRRFIEWMEAIKKAYGRSVESPFEIGETVNEFLGKWLVDHVQNADMLYRDFIAARKQDKA